MKKYICPNCGFRSIFQTAKINDIRTCKNCGASVKSSSVVLASMMMLDIKRSK